MALEDVLSVAVEVIQDAHMGTCVHDHLPSVVCQVQHRHIAVQPKRPDDVLNRENVQVIEIEYTKCEFKHFTNVNNQTGHIIEKKFHT